MIEETEIHFTLGLKLGGLNVDEFESLAREQGAFLRREGDTIYLKKDVGVTINAHGKHAAISID